MGRLSVRAALAAGYQGAGTFEFLMEPDGSYYFMEVNCRIQVEHPVTEMVSGIDLVAQQFYVAAGHPLELTQADVNLRGTAIECRINAEDPARGFSPAPGVIREFHPAAGPFVRVDTHIRSGDAIAPEYDSLLAKLIVWAPDRQSAISRMRRALTEFHITGSNIHTTREFLLELMDHEQFRLASQTTSLVDQLMESTSRKGS